MRSLLSRHITQTRDDISTTIRSTWLPRVLNADPARSNGVSGFGIAAPVRDPVRASPLSLHWPESTLSPDRVRLIGPLGSIEGPPHREGSLMATFAQEVFEEFKALVGYLHLDFDFAAVHVEASFYPHPKYKPVFTLIPSTKLSTSRAQPQA